MDTRAFLIGAAVVLLLPASARAIPFASMYLFGDSLVDTGNLYAATGGVVPPSPPYYQGRSSNGPLAVEMLADRRLAGGAGGPNFHDYAYAGATTGVGNVWDGGTPTTAGTGVLTAPFTGIPVPGGQPLPGMATEVADYAASVGPGGGDPHGLYIVWGGPDDFISGGSANVSLAVNDIAGEVSTLAAMGAPYILVPNMVDLSLTPRVSAANDPAVTAAYHSLSQAYDAALAAAIAGIDRQFATHVMLFDVASLFNDVIADPSSFGLSNVTEGYLTCAQLNGPQACGSPDEYLYWDDLHPTSATSGILATHLARSLPEPGEFVLMLLGWIVMLAAGRGFPTRRRRRSLLP